MSLIAICVYYESYESGRNDREFDAPMERRDAFSEGMDRLERRRETQFRIVTSIQIAGIILNLINKHFKLLP